MADLLSMSERIIDEGVYEGPQVLNRVIQELSEVADGVAVVESFSNVVAFTTDDGLTLFDTAMDRLAPDAIRALRGWTDDKVHSIIYTHGHFDHAGGCGAFLADAERRGDPRPRVVAHAAVEDRFHRYNLTSGYNGAINERQFRGGGSSGTGSPQFFSDWVFPDVTYDQRLGLAVGGLSFELRHGKGETDDHSWAWFPEQRAICAGDFFIWVFPNAGNPQKVQRYPIEWAAALREMAAMDPELFLPAHGLPIAGSERIKSVLDNVAGALETIVSQTLELMNDGATLDTIIGEVEVPAELMAQPYLRPTYDEPEFVVRNLWRGYGGWYDGNPSRLKPAPDAVIAGEVSRLAGGSDRLAKRALEVADAGDLRLAAHLVEWAVQAEPDNAGAHDARAAVYRERRSEELSLMAQGVFGAAARESEARDQ